MLPGLELRAHVPEPWLPTHWALKCDEDLQITFFLSDPLNTGSLLSYPGKQHSSDLFRFQQHTHTGWGILQPPPPTSFLYFSAFETSLHTFITVHQVEGNGSYCVQQNKESPPLP